MSLGKHLSERLQTAHHEGPEAAQLYNVGDTLKQLVVVNELVNASATLELFDYDRYSVTLCSLNVVDQRQLTAELNTVSTQDEARSMLSSCAADISRRLYYLEEPLAVWELSCDDLTVQLRSAPPHYDDSAVFYWEVALRFGEYPSATIARYHWAPGMIDREVIAYPATFILIARIVDSLQAALSQ